MTPLAIRPRWFQRSWTWWFTLVVLTLVAVARLRLLNFPLERDEGEYAYNGQLILQGISPYALAYNMKFPGTYYAYAALMAAFGETPAGIHFGLLLLTTATAVMLFWLGQKILDETAGMVAATAYALLAISTAMFGFAAHATHFGAFCVTAGLCLLWLAREMRNWLAAAGAGIFFGCAVLTKQHAAFVALWAGGIILAQCFREKEISWARRAGGLLLFGLAVVLPFGLCSLMLWRAGVFGKFWFWTMDYARQYVSIIRPSAAAANLTWSLHSIFSDCWLWWFAVAGVAVVWWDKRLRDQRRPLLGLALASFLTTAPGFYFRTHYFLLALPAAALLAGCAVSGAAQALKEKNFAARFRRWPAGIFILAVAATLFKDADVVSVLTRVGSHALYGIEPFQEAEVAAAYIHDHSPPAARVIVLGSEPELPFLARRHSATGYILVFALMEPQPFARQMQTEMIHEAETAAPEFAVFVNVNYSWLQQPQSDPTLFNWWSAYQTNYDLVGLAEIASPVATHYFWGADAVRHGKLQLPCLKLYRRKLATPGAPPAAVFSTAPPARRDLTP